MIHAQHIHNVFDLDEVERIKKLLSLIPAQDHIKNRSIVTNGFTSKDPIYLAIKKLVIDRINTVCEHKVSNLTVGMHLITRDPFGIHSDAPGKGDNGSGIAYLVPLEMVRNDSAKPTSSTIIFDQVWTDTTSIEDYIASGPDKVATPATDVWHMLSEKCDPAWAPYLSVKLVAEWQIGSVIVWDRRLLHASDDFLAAGLIEKSALVLFTNSQV
jgi:hypothetical protein